MSFFGYIPPPPPRGSFPQPRDWLDTPKVDKHENPWTATRDNLKSIVTLLGSILALTATFATTLVGSGKGWGVKLLCASWLCFIGALAATLFTQFRLASYLMGTRVRRNQLIHLSNLAYWLLFLGLLLLGLSQYLRLTASTSSSGEYFRRLGTVGPFPVAGRTLCADKSPEADCLLRNASRFDALEIAKLPHQPDLIVLIGFADRRPLGGELRHAYDSNAGLARARTEWVRQGIILRNPRLAGGTSFMSLYSGPQFTAADVTSFDLEGDRIVEIWAIAASATGTASAAGGFLSK